MCTFCIRHFQIAGSITRHVQNIIKSKCSVHLFKSFNLVNALASKARCSLKKVIIAKSVAVQRMFLGGIARFQGRIDQMRLLCAVVRVLILIKRYRQIPVDLKLRTNNLAETHGRHCRRDSARLCGGLGCNFTVNKVSLCKAMHNVVHNDNVSVAPCGVVEPTEGITRCATVDG